MKPYMLSLRDFQRETISKAMEASGNNVSHAAALLDVNRTHLYALMERCGYEQKERMSTGNRGNDAWRELG
jgi:DNA-binding NtrC family response regulator